MPSSKLEEHTSTGLMLRLFRVAHRLRLKDLSDATGISISRLSRIERGIGLTRRTEAAKIADALAAVKKHSSARAIGR